MSVYYNFYTEAFLKDEWHCIDPVGLYVRFNGEIHQELYSTFWNGSRSYFGEAWDRLRENAGAIRFSETSPEFQKHILDSLEDSYAWAEEDEEAHVVHRQELIQFMDKNLLTIPYKVFIDMLPDEHEHTYHGVYHKDAITAFNNGELEDLYERELSTEEYAKLDGDMRKVYAYFEWDDPMSWITGLRRLAEHVTFRVRDFTRENYEEPGQVRIVMYAS